MQPPVEDLYAFLGLPRGESSIDAIRSAVATKEREVQSAQGLSLAELSRRRSLVLQAKRLLLAPDRKAEYDHALIAGVPLPMTAPVAPPEPNDRRKQPVAQPSTAREADQPKSSSEADDAATGFDPFSLPGLLGLAAAFLLLSTLGAAGMYWLTSDKPSQAAPTSESKLPLAVDETAPAPERNLPDDGAPPAIRADGEGTLLFTAENATIAGPTASVATGDGPARIVNWRADDSLAWRFDAVAPTIYQATLTYAISPASKEGRVKIVVGETTMTRTLGEGAFMEGAFRDEFFLAVKGRGPKTLMLEPAEMKGPELMQFRSLRLTPKQKSAN